MNIDSIIEVYGDSDKTITDAARTIWTNIDGLDDMTIHASGDGATLTRGDLTMEIGEDLGAGTSTDPEDEGYVWGWSHTIYDAERNTIDYGAGDTIEEALRAMHEFAA